jgi:hypothetical protein
MATIVNPTAFATLIGPTTSVSETVALGGAYAQYEADFEKYAEVHWQKQGANWNGGESGSAGGNYYDRAFIYYEWYARTGDLTYLDRANAIAESYREGYLEARNYDTQTWWSMPKGLTAHYLVNGDDASKVAIGRMADDLMSDGWHSDNNWANLFDSSYSEGREQARVLEILTQADLIDAPTQNGWNWRTMADSLADKFLDTNYRAPQPFMQGLVNEALINYYEQVNPDARIIDYVKGQIDYLWKNKWDAATQSFRENDGPSAESNALISTGFGFVYEHTGDPIYKGRGDLVFQGLVGDATHEGAWLDGSKQFNQAYSVSANYIGYLSGEDSQQGPIVPAPQPATGNTGNPTPSMPQPGSNPNDSHWISGTAKSDVLQGSDANEIICGGLRKDAMTGAGGNDIFLFRSKAEIRGDVITDFSAGDVIKLSAIDAAAGNGVNDAFKFIGQAAFSSTPGELRYKQDATNDFTYVRGDINGDGSADFSIKLEGVHDLSARDFHL